MEFSCHAIYRVYEGGNELEEGQTIRLKANSDEELRDELKRFCEQINDIESKYSLSNVSELFWSGVHSGYGTLGSEGFYVETKDEDADINVLFSFWNFSGVEKEEMFIY